MPLTRTYVFMQDMGSGSSADLLCFGGVISKAVSSAEVAQACREALLQRSHLLGGESYQSGSGMAGGEI